MTNTKRILILTTAGLAGSLFLAGLYFAIVLLQGVRVFSLTLHEIDAPERVFVWER